MPSSLASLMHDIRSAGQAQHEEGLLTDTVEILRVQREKDGAGGSSDRTVVYATTLGRVVSQGMGREQMIADREQGVDRYRIVMRRAMRRTDELQDEETVVLDSDALRVNGVTYQVEGNDEGRSDRYSLSVWCVVAG